MYTTNLYRLMLVVFAILLGASCAKNKNEHIIQEESPTFCLNDFMKDDIVKVAIEKKAITESILLNAKVEANPDKLVHFVSLVSGVVTKTYFSSGEKVKKGQLLLEMMSSELSNLNSEKSSLQSQILVAQRELESVQEMHRDKIASQRDLIAAQSHLDVLRAELQNTNAQLNLYSASSERGVFQVRASSSGTIISKNVAAGMQVSAEGDPLFTISDLDEVWIMANIYVGNVPYVKQGMPVEIKALPYANEVFFGEINAVSQVFDSDERVLKARIVMDNIDGKLMPGMLVDVTVEKEDGLMANAAPVEALVFDDNQHFLVLYKSDCDIEVRKVTPNIQNANTVYFENNIEAGEQIIIKNHLLIYNHLKALK
ncbi:efflux RND transporter periplasmic adaptor subunit [Gelidibacter maritimus]|uniref:Efflux RND transporter periplasmic adaptor subunit n=1 Tax=Gelidibacter maritimus TaxID=2761487 RepID=A0A7W2M569_9FLAO|nr:efflux RND transporter periplasmic adaptor subunit [Gelidibacter maritimus]MBA6152933.1 efflux RND transporter periplasmic adaptor subunit [Gelidibacter maritimus]